MKAKRKKPIVNTSVCQVCQEERDEKYIDTKMVDVGDRYGLPGQLYFLVDFCVDRRCCFTTAAERMEAYCTGQTLIEPLPAKKGAR